MSPCSRTVRWTETAEPLPSPPPSEFLNYAALNTISSRPDLFVVSTPINVDRFKSLLSSHPNQPFVQSVVRGLREGFWPFADTRYGQWPLTWDNSFRPPRSSDEAAFIESQVRQEQEKGRFSPEFGPDLMPGMYSMPVHAVPKPGTDKLRLVTDHSAGEFALNHMISKDDIAGVTLDNVQDLGAALRSYRDQFGEVDMLLWKADVSEAYRQMPMHPLWQIKQVVSLGSRRFVDRRNVFGGRASQRIFHAFMSLMTWIAVTKLLILLLMIYVDDSFSAQRTRQMTFYRKYNKLLPSDLVKLLNLWDFVGLPHEERKQIFGSELPIIGFLVDPNAMRACMSLESRLNLVSAIKDFAQHGSRRPLRDFQRIAGHLNWALNVYPLLRPGLSSLYAKTAGKLEHRAPIWINRDVVRELLWAAAHLETSEGVFFLQSESWSYPDLPDSVLEVYCDASPMAMGFWFPSLRLGFQASIPVATETIFHYEALCVTAAILEAVASRLPPTTRKLAVFTDNLNTVQLFNSLAALPSMNWMLMRVVDTILPISLDLRVFHIPGCSNVVADRLSRLSNVEALSLVPGLSIHTFSPPRPSLGAASQ